jgi:Fur family peroxide stress response transcriptional regulator
VNHPDAHRNRAGFSVAGFRPLLRIILDKDAEVRDGVFRPMKPEEPTTLTYDETIAGRGMRMTEQRRSVYEALMGQADHPTAVEVFMRVKGKLPSISLATVYNCLETLAGCGLVRHVHHDREPSRYCANLKEHAHLFCEGCGSVTDLPLRAEHQPEELWELPAGMKVTRREVSFQGLCPACVAKAAAPAAPGAKPARKSKS